MNTVVIGLLGTTLDRRGQGPRRWEQWRPTVALCMHEDLWVDRFELLAPPRYTALSRQVCEDIAQVSPDTEVRVHTLDLSDPWDLEEVYNALCEFARTYPFDVERENYLIHITTGTHVCQIVLFLLAEARHLPGRLVQTGPGKRGASPAGAYGIIDLDLSRYDRIAARFQQEQRDDVSFLKSGIDTRNAAFNALIEQIERVAIRSDAPILLTGPTGAGKSQLARRIYELKLARRQVKGAFVEVNCATLRGDGMMPALFGHTKGAFTGAVQARPGLLRTADGGVLFLDEVAELGADEQAMLLRAVEEGRFLPVGADREVESRFQLMCGTNRDLQKAVAEGRFREDLLARINCWAFRLPGLRERPEDIEPNLEYELERFAQRTGERVRFNREARDRFLAFARDRASLWTANFRDLNGAILRMGTLAAGGRITVDLVKAECARLEDAWRRVSKPDDGLESLLGPEQLANLDPFDRVQLAEVLRVCRASRTLSDAGRSLFARSRAQRKSTNDADRLRKYLARFGLTWPEVRT